MRPRGRARILRRTSPHLPRDFTSVPRLPFSSPFLLALAGVAALSARGLDAAAAGPPPSVAVAARHAEHTGLSIDYRAMTAEELANDEPKLAAKA